MNPEAQRAAIAKAFPKLFRTESMYGFCRIVKVRENLGNMIPCDPLNDLNATHEVEKMLTKQQYVKYIDTLLTVTTNLRSWGDTGHEDIFEMIHATAAQRLEAILKTLDLWVQSNES